METLLVGGELDFSTPPQIMTKELLPSLPNGQQVVLPGIGHTGTFFAVQPEASSRLINTYFDTGKVDTSLYQTQTRRLHHSKQLRQDGQGLPRPGGCAGNPDRALAARGWPGGCTSGAASAPRRARRSGRCPRSSSAWAASSSAR